MALILGGAGMEWVIGTAMIAASVFAFVIVPLIVAWFLHAGGAWRDGEEMVGNERQGQHPGYGT